MSNTQKKQLTIIFEDETHTTEIDDQTTILEAGEDLGLDLPYSCRGGICTNCQAKIKDGSAEMAENHALTDGEIQDGFVLTCQAHPTSDNITVDYDAI